MIAKPVREANMHQLLRFLTRAVRAGRLAEIVEAATEIDRRLVEAELVGADSRVDLYYDSRCAKGDAK